MILPALLSALPLLAAPPAAPAALSPPPQLSGSGLVALRARRVESVANGTLEHAVILIEDGKIVTIGEDLPIERGIRVVDLPDEWVVVPGFVHAYSRLGMDGQGSGGTEPQQLASKELYPRAEEYEKVLEAGVTTLTLYPAGNNAPGQAVVIEPRGDTKEAMILRDHAYLKVVMRSNASSKKILEKAFGDVEKHREKVAKEREKWEKEQEKKKKSKSSKKDDEKEEKKDEESEGSDEFVPPAPDPDVAAWIEVLEGRLPVLFAISQASDWLHLLDAIGDKEFRWDLRIPLTLESDIFYVFDDEQYPIDVPGIGDKEKRVIVEPTISLHPGTMRQRNLPAELARSGAHVVFIPREDDLARTESWRRDVADLVAAGMDPQAALRAMTLNPAELLGVADRVGSLETGKDANLVFLSGDPFDPATEIEAVLLRGELVHGEVHP